MSTTLQRLNNIYLDIRIILNQIDRNPRADITNMKQQMSTALISIPNAAKQLEEIKSLPALYKFGKQILEELRTEIKIEKEN